MYRLFVGIAVLLVASLCLTLASNAAANQGFTELKNAQGESLGTATFTEGSGGVQVSVQVQRGLTPGLHGIHIHAVGKCEAPDFMSAGGHYNPTGKQHGLKNPNGPHGGDLPNLNANANGGANYQGIAMGVTLASGATSLFDADGSALVIHANADDDVTDPAGNSGGRVMCGVITQQSAQLPRTGEPVSWLLGILALGVLLLTAGYMMRTAQNRA